MNELLKIRNRKKAKKPTFLKQGAHLRAKLHKNWRRPRGGHSKFRLKLRSYRRQPSVGFSSPREVRGLTREGHKFILIHNIGDIEGVTTPVILASNLGSKKKLSIIKKCEEKKIQILNLKDINIYKKKIEDSMKKKKDLIKKRREKRDKKKEVKQDAKKEAHHEHNHEEEKKKLEQEKRKILEKK